MRKLLQFAAEQILHVKAQKWLLKLLLNPLDVCDVLLSKALVDEPTISWESVPNDEVAAVCKANLALCCSLQSRSCTRRATNGS